ARRRHQPRGLRRPRDAVGVARPEPADERPGPTVQPVAEPAVAYPRPPRGGSGGRSALALGSTQSQSRLSHTVARLEERGWVRRERSHEDGRGNLAVLTAAGWDVVRAVAPGH